MPAMLGQQCAAAAQAQRAGWINTPSVLRGAAPSSSLHHAQRQPVRAVRTLASKRPDQ